MNKEEKEAADNKIKYRVIEVFNNSHKNYGTRRIKAELVLWAFSNAKIDLKKVKIFHTDRGKEFCNEKPDQLLIENNITRSLSHKGALYDNAVAEATYKAIKTEFIQNRDFGTTENLKVLFSDYVHWFNYCRLHSSLGYMTPIEYKNNELLKKMSKKVLTHYDEDKIRNANNWRYSYETIFSR